jgi:hypothetical protein
VALTVIAAHICDEAGLFRDGGISHPIPGNRNSRYFGLETIAIMLPSSSSGAWALALS